MTEIPDNIGILTLKKIPDLVSTGSFRKMTDHAAMYSHLLLLPSLILPIIRPRLCFLPRYDSRGVRRVETETRRRGKNEAGVAGKPYQMFRRKDRLIWILQEEVEIWKEKTD